jgi:hypothetical protein
MGRSIQERLTEVAKRSYWHRDDARLVVAAWRASGLSQAEFASRYDLGLRRISRWAARLAGGETDGAQRRTAPLVFHPVRLARRVERAAEGGMAPIEIMLQDGGVIRVPPGSAREDLEVVLSALSAVATVAQTR